jgi:predicted transcriptional regulator
VNSDAPFWNPRSGAFNGALLRLAVVMRGWTVAEFAVVCEISLACLYKALGGCGVTDRIAIRIFDGLRKRQPLPPIPEFPNAL